ncbi:MAG TPA: hypothetical protein VMX94_02305 [Armatimonadota bacterium]|nr:hypothetical protein [Armatimonadota bacterium]
MSRAVSTHKVWLMPVCLIAAVIVLVCCWQQLQAQAPAPGVAQPSPAPGVAALTPSGEPTLTLSSVLPKAVKVMKVKNWDGQVTELLRFKYKTMDNRVITAHLPGVYRKETMPRAAWDTLFQVFAMDREARLAVIERNTPPDLSSYMQEFMAEISGEVREGMFGSPSPAAAALGYARSNLPSMGVQLPPMPPALIGMP